MVVCVPLTGKTPRDIPALPLHRRARHGAKKRGQSIRMQAKVVALHAKLAASVQERVAQLQVAQDKFAALMRSNGRAANLTGGACPREQLRSASLKARGGLARASGCARRP